MMTSSVRDLLLIHWRSPETALDWLCIDSNGGIGNNTHEFTPPQSVITSARQIVVLIPSEQVTLMVATLPTQRVAQARKAAPFAIEEQLAAAVDTLQFVVARHRPTQWWIAALQPEILHVWLADLKLRGIVPDRLLPDVLALPVESEGAVVMNDGERSLIRIGSHKAFAAETSMASVLLQADRIQESVIHRLHSDMQHPPLQHLAAGLRHSPDLNLLGGEFTPRHRGSDVSRLWRRLAWLGAAVLVLGFATMKLEQIHLTQRLQALNVEMERLYREHFPDAKQVPNPLAQMQSALNAAAGSVAATTSSLGLLSQSAPIIASQPRVMLKAADYRNGALTLQILAPDVQVLDGLRESLGASGGLKATLENADNNNGAIDGHIKLEPISKGRS